MRFTGRRLWLLAAMGIGLLIPGPGCAVPSERQSLESGGHERTWRLYVPPNLPQDRPVPLVVAFHGSGSSGRGMENFSKFDPVADREGFIVLYPDGLWNNWNDGRASEDIRAQKEHIDDGAFIEALIAEVSAHHRIDGKRIYATGMSNGGFFVHYLGHRLPHTFAAIAPVAGGMAPLVADNFGAGDPVAVMIVQGTDDPLVPYSGGDVARGRGRMVSTVQAAELWAKRNGCATAPVEEKEPDTDPADGCRVVRKTWAGPAPVVLRTIHGGGHTWPGGSQYMPRILIGEVCRDFDATEEIWAFFQEYPKP